MNMLGYLLGAAMMQMSDSVNHPLFSSANYELKGSDIMPTAKNEGSMTREKLDRYMSNHEVNDSRQLREFSIQGNKMMAFSKKDAITRLKAMKKLKRK